MEAGQLLSAFWLCSSDTSSAEADLLAFLLNVGPPFPVFPKASSQTNCVRWLPDRAEYFLWLKSSPAASCQSSRCRVRDKREIESLSIFPGSVLQLTQVVELHSSSLLPELVVPGLDAQVWLGVCGKQWNDPISLPSAGCCVGS